MQFDWKFLADPRLAEALIAGLKTTVVLSLCSAAGALLIGIVLATCRVGGPRIVQRAARGYIDVARNVPLIITMFFFYFGLTNLFPPMEYGLLRTPHLAMVVTIVAIALVEGAFVAEVLRQGVESVPVGQLEAAAACGIPGPTMYRHVVIPQLLPLVLPGLSSEMVNVIKGSTFAMTISVMDLMWQGQNLESETFKGLEIMTAVSVVYFLLSFATIGVFRLFERLAKSPVHR
ncbi:amino acid ABC transporter permease [Variovorax sp. KK3]|uniref:amino acid ABC transporter permease n=1 Tax=Variovorax sp. KK3 TaxID=1855728 RepID=UPI00097C5A7B|nr:amino acid ABC transporter permease [Variovorax sp. KK3]